jgi:hypothetical protein
VHIIVKIIVTSIYFSSYKDVDLLRSMSADCCMPRRLKGGGRHGWHVCVFHLALARGSFSLGTCVLSVRCPPTQYPTNNQPPSHQNISINNRRMSTFYVAILCAYIVGRRLCSMVALFNYLKVSGSRLSSRNDGKLANKSMIGHNLENTWVILANRVPNQSP